MKSNSKFIKALGKPAKFQAEGEETVFGYITDIKIHLVEGEPQMFIGGSDENIDGMAICYFNPNEVTILE